MYDARSVSNFFLDRAAASGRTPNALLGVDGKKKEGSNRAMLQERLISAADALRDSDLEVAIVQIEALANHRRRSR